MIGNFSTQKKGKKMTKIIVVLIIGSLALIPMAQAQEIQENNQTRVLAEELLGAMQVQTAIEKSFEMVKEMMVSQANQMGLPEGEASEKAQGSMNKTMDMVMAEMTWDKLKDDYISIYAETFNVEELQGLVDFYKGPIGQKFVEKQPELMRRSMLISQKQMAELMPKIQAMTQQIKQKTAPQP